MGQEDPLEKEMTTHFSILPWEIPWAEEPGRLQSMGTHTNGQIIKQKINKETQVLNDALDEMDLIGIFRTFHPNG